MTDKFDFLGCRHKHIKLCVNTIIKLVYRVDQLSAEITERKSDL